MIYVFYIIYWQFHEKILTPNNHHMFMKPFIIFFTPYHFSTKYLLPQIWQMKSALFNVFGILGCDSWCLKLFTVLDPNFMNWDFEMELTDVYSLAHPCFRPLVQSGHLRIERGNSFFFFFTAPSSYGIFS